MPNSTPPTAILIIDDQSTDARLVQEALHDGVDGSRIHTLTDAREAIAYLRKEPPFGEAPTPDVIVLGFNPPARTGREAFEGIRTIELHPPVIILSRTMEEPVSRYLHTGAADFLVKSDLRALPAAVEKVVTTRAPLRKLSPRQVEVLRLIAEGLATREIAARLEVSGKTVEAHRAELMRRLGIRTVAGLVRYALKASLVELGAD
ncbi:MAG TPA: response regulator transcription factor [Gemmatimonadales bacterium]|jgi:DNA-binding NarL/FixJ family response regulator|nr:response regulator transcription factor [Gemmatimonadales bacterium]